MRLRTVLFAAALIAAPAACSQNPPVSNEAGPRTMLRVENHAFLDMNIYVVYRGQRRRVGTATGASTTTMELPIRFTTMETISFIADPVGGGQRPISQEIMVSPGDIVTMTIPAA